MQTNGVNGGHRHEVSENRGNPTTFRCRLDMELHAVTVHPLVDQAQVTDHPQAVTSRGASIR